MSKTNAHYTEHTLEDANAMPDPEYDQEQYRKDTERMHWLDQKWQEVYKCTKDLTYGFKPGDRK